MLRPSKKMLFAIEAVLDIAYHAGGEPVQSREITRRQGIPRRYLEQTLQQMVRAGILVGVRGPRGGYRLARERRRISVGEVVRVVRALETAEDPYQDMPASELGKQVIRPMWGDLTEEIMARLDAISIDELCMRAYKDGIPSEAHQKLDFII
ncbi:putative transcriptional regulator of cysteine synthase Rrf2 family [Paramagnetospirillum magnetotacticum MS-1]|jgi:Rrf2 family iron-sulfur cluster assembly transcriptional regulator|uniref:Putative transcriptional regulator of cysteine synthase Rrf2 family n=1 Tax=Paramagnetospirillum magnetotacticum MS-1 TaxID=272627 RepID=A0A0C2U993_PARME|nr:Rrf2 family transcriptional regulator [Paramagnetospirillum magnetotacticum]KIL98067.1 putative transcriptional regulator of cysteine synthase Rrf2 family [Paramagnetospirillum magnetotacticum MS-1]